MGQPLTSSLDVLPLQDGEMMGRKIQHRLKQSFKQLTPLIVWDLGITSQDNRDFRQVIPPLKRVWRNGGHTNNGSLIQEMTVGVRLIHLESISFE